MDQYFLAKGAPKNGQRYSSIIALLAMLTKYPPYFVEDTTTAANMNVWGPVTYDLTSQRMGYGPARIPSKP